MDTTQKKVKLGFIGLGARGPGVLRLLLSMDDVDVVAVCDHYEDRVRKGLDIIREERGVEAAGYDDYKKILVRDDVDAVVIATSWTTHSRIAVEAMRAGKHVATEVGGAASVEECWSLVRASEESGRFCMMLENCCYGRRELALLNMVRQNVFGELVHMRGGYGHDLRAQVAEGVENRHYRHHDFLNRNGELYPTHELGPIANMLRLNRGNRMMSLVSMASKARGLRAWGVENNHRAAGLDWAEGDVVTTMIKCARGETILLTHDNTLPRPYSRMIQVQGTKGVFMEDGNGIYLEGITPPGPGEHEFESATPYLEKYDHPLWKWFESEGVRGGHGGMDYLVQRAFVESVRDGHAPPIDVYDTASWMSITCLTEESIAMGSTPVAVPDFTNGAWTTRGADYASRYALDEVRNELY